MSQLADAARRYVGVRFRHRGRDRTGLDCAGLVWCAYRDCGVELPDYRLYGREPFKDGLVKRVSAALGEPVKVGGVTLADIREGDVVLISYDHDPHHVAIVGDHDYGGTRLLTLIHADGWGPSVETGRRAGRAGSVHEQRLTPDVKITHVYRRPI